MGIDLSAHLFIGLHAGKATNASGATLLDRFKAGEFSRRGDAEKGILTLDDLPRGRLPGGLEIDSPGDWYNRTRAQYYVGRSVAYILNRSAGWYDAHKPLDADRLDAAFVKTRKALRALGIRQEPKLYVLTSVS